MRNNTTLNVRLQPPEDQIDYPVSDSFRDHYAAQGLTYPSGRFSRPQRTIHHPVTNDDQAFHAIRQELLGWKSKAIHLEARCAKLEEENQRLQSRSTARQAQATGYKGVALDVCA